MVRIIFLGTAGSMAVTSKQTRSSGGIIIQHEDLQFHLDPGPGTFNKAKEYGINLQHTSAILVSHHHVNHCNDLNALVEAMTHAGLERRGVVLASKSVVEESEQNKPFLTAYHKKLVEKIIPLERNHKVGIELVEIDTLSTEHTDPTSLGFKFYFPRATVSYTGDTKFSLELVEQLKGTDILILNVPYAGNKSEGMNLDTEAAVKIVSAVRPKLAIMTHFGLEMLKIDPMVEAREVQRITGITTIAARDGLVIAPEGYENQSPVKGYS